MNQKHKVCTACGFVGSAEYRIPLFKMGDVKCPKCHQASMVELRSEEGQTVLAQREGQPKVWSDADRLANY